MKQALELVENALEYSYFFFGWVSPLYMMGAYFVDFAGRLVFLSKGDDAQQASQSELRGVGYY